MANNAENVSISWRHHDIAIRQSTTFWQDTTRCIGVTQTWPSFYIWEDDYKDKAVSSTYLHTGDVSIWWRHHVGKIFAARKLRIYFLGRPLVVSLSYILRVIDQVSVGGWLRKRCLNMLMYAADTTTPVVAIPGLILGLRPASERRRYFVTTSLIG